MKLCFYHSIMDWHHPDYEPRKPWNDIDTATPEMDRYVEFMKGQLKELLTDYGPIGIVWFDGHWEETWNFERGADLLAYVRSLQPNTIVNNRVGKDRKGVAGTGDGQEPTGDYGTPEQYIPASGFASGVEWEACMTMNGTWGFNKNDQNWKSTKTLIRNLVDIASKGGNYLLNVGPTGDGEIPSASVERLKEVGQWMRANGQSIHGTTASPFAELTWGRCTKRTGPDGGTLYLHVFDWPQDGKLRVPGLRNKITKASLLATDDPPATAGLRLVTSREGHDTIVSLPAEPIDKIDTVIALEIAGPLEIASHSGG
jgi:alpha-L-fucosidase